MPTPTSPPTIELVWRTRQRPRPACRAPGFALLELLISLLMLTGAILAFGTSALHVLNLERALGRQADLWRAARSVIALHRAGWPAERMDAEALALGARLIRPGKSTAPGPALPAGWERWRIESASDTSSVLELMVRILPAPAKNGPAASRPPPPP